MHTSSPSSSHFRILFRLKIYLAPHIKSLIGVFISLAFTSSAVLGLGRGIQYLIDKGFSSHNPVFLDHALLVLLSVAAMLALATYARTSLINEVCEKVVAALRQDIYAHVVRLSPGYFEIHKSSDVLSRLTTDTTVVNSIIASVLSITLRNILLFVGGMVLLVMTSFKLTAYVLVIVPLVLVPIITLGRKVRGLSRLSQEKVAAVGAHVEESLSGIRTVQAYTREGFECERFSVQVKEALETALTRVRVRSRLVALVIAMVFGSIACVLWLGGHEVVAGRMTPGALSSFIFYAIVVASSVGALSEVAGDLQRAAGAAERLFELMDAQSVIVNPAHPVLLPLDYAGDISFEDVTFFYPARTEHPALSHFSLHIHPGETVALVGPSGGGKSTVLQLLLRFYDPNNGTVRLGKTDIRMLTLEHLRSQYGLVSQEPVIFSCSVLDNIRYAKPEASEEEVRLAAKAAEASEFIERLPEGIHTFVGERGVRLSGGQRQRLAIARAILKDPKILLLDEATSALDAENEQAVQHALEGLMQDRTTLVIAHRLSTILRADKIIVLDEGRIEAIGTHKELVMQDGLYARLAKLQFSE